MPRPKAGEDFCDLGTENFQEQRKQLIEPEIFHRKSLFSRKIESSNQTMLNFKTVTIAIPQYEIKNEKKMLITKTTVLWQIETEISGTTNKTYVLRKDSDFYFLRKCLLENYPYIMIPALPKRKESTNSEHLA